MVDEYNEAESEENLKEAFPHLTNRQILAAYKYYRAYPKEIDELIRINETITAESVAGLFTFRKERDSVIFLIDENLNTAIAEVLKSAGIDAIHVNTLGLAGASDREVLDEAARQKRCVVTRNRHDC